MNHRSRSTAASALALLLAATAGCGHSSPSAEGRHGERPPVIGVSLMNLSSEFIVMINKAMEQRAKELGAKLIVNDAQRSPERQIQQVESFIAQQVDVIILNPCEVEASTPAVDKALAAHIPIVNVNSETKTVPTAFVGSRDEQSGRLAMGYIAGRLGGKGEVVMMHGYMLAQNPGLHLFAEQTAEWDRAKAISLMENWIQAHGDRIAAVFAQNDEMAMGALLALEQAKKKDKIIVVGVDAIADALEAVRQSRLDATVFQDAEAQGRQAVETALAIVRKRPFEKETYIPFRLVTKENVGQYAK